MKKSITLLFIHLLLIYQPLFSQSKMNIYEIGKGEILSKPYVNITYLYDDLLTAVPFTDGVENYDWSNLTGVIDFNENVIGKILREGDLEFIPLFSCDIYVFMAKSNPLAKKKLIRMKDLMEYPCCSFDQGERNSFYFAEEVLSTYSYKKLIKVNDRATILNLMVGLNGYTLCSGIICQELNGPEYIAIPLDTEESMRIGYIKHKKMRLSELGKKYVEELKQYEGQQSGPISAGM